MNKIPAFTLFESVVAISIITVLIAMSSMIYGNLTNAEKPMVYYQAKNEIDRMFYDAGKAGLYLPKQVDLGECQIEQKVSLYQEREGLYEITYTALSGSKIIHTERHLVAAAKNG